MLRTLAMAPAAGAGEEAVTEVALEAGAAEQVEKEVGDPAPVDLVGRSAQVAGGAPLRRMRTPNRART